MFPVPFNEEKRLKALAGYDVLDTPPEEAFDSLTRLALRYFDTPVALVSLVDEARQWFKSVQGLDVRETDREVAFCGHAIMANDPLIVLDATVDPRFADNTLVCDKPGIRFYAGAPLVTPHGFRLGTFCVIDFKPRSEFPDDHMTALQDFATAAMQSLNARRLAYAQQNADEAQIAEDSRVAAFSAIAHEIRSPIAAFKGCLAAIESEVYGPLGDEQYGVLIAAMSETADQVITMTDRMLNLARLRTGNVELVEAQSSVAALLKGAQQAWRFMEDHGEIDIRIEDSTRGALLSADEILVAQMLGNLITNAVKYSHRPGQITLTASVDRAGNLELAVSDSGIGMNADDLASALRPYSQVVRPGRKSVKGVGIGLPLVKQLIELHGGRLQLVSAEGKGTKAALLFPSYRVSSV